MFLSGALTGVTIIPTWQWRIPKEVYRANLTFFAFLVVVTGFGGTKQRSADRRHGTQTFHRIGLTPLVSAFHGILGLD